MQLEVYKKSDFYEDYISSQKEYYERANADAYFAERLAEKDKELRRHKYKRCLAMAKWCEMCHKELLTRACLPTKQNWNRHDEWRYFVDFWYRYEYRFRKLAEKFKEAK